MNTSLMRKTSIFPFFDDVFNDYFIPSYKLREQTLPEVKVKEEENSYEIAVAVPGVNKDDIKIDIDDNKLTISSTKQTEFSYSEFTKSWTLPAHVDAASIKATCQDGVLRVSVPKVQKEKIYVPIE